MNPERWKQVDHLLQLVLERPLDQREAFLRQACAGDTELEREVHSLLSSEQKAATFRRPEDLWGSSQNGPGWLVHV